MSASAGLVLDGVTKSFGATRALDDVTVAFRPRELCGLAGHNGAGKSTLINVLCGTVTPDRGTVLLHGVPLRPRHYRDAMRMGVFRVSQELTLFENLTVADNATLGTEAFFTRAGVLDRHRMGRELGDFLGRIGLDVLPLGGRVGDLPLSLKQLTEIVRCLFSAEKRGIGEPVLLFDEPTSGLTHSQAGFVAERLRALAGRAVIILTSHRGRELLDLSQRTVVMRDGRVVADRPTAGLDPASLEEAMVGGPVAHDRPRRAARGTAGPTRIDGGPPALAVEGIGDGGGRLVARAGEIVGLAGEGEEKSRVVAAIAGWRAAPSLAVRVRGAVPGRSARARAGAGIRYVPGERAREGFSVWQRVTWNVTLPRLARGDGRGLAASPAAERRSVAALVAAGGVRVPDIEGPIASLSGGNQQRLLMARAIDAGAAVLLCDRPTRGVDVMATALVHDAIRAAAAAGIACVVASDEAEELAALCDRVATLRDGALGDLALTGDADRDTREINDAIAV